MLQNLLLVFDFNFQDTLLVLFIACLTCSITDTIQRFLFGFPVLFLLEALFLFRLCSDSRCEVTAATSATAITKCCSFVRQFLIGGSHSINDAVILGYCSIQLLKLCFPSSVARRADSRLTHGICLRLMKDFLV